MIAHCRETGAFGGVVGTSTLAVGGRCLRLSHRNGAFLSQHRTDSRLGDAGIALLKQGGSADETIAKIASGGQELEWRQLAALDGQGRAAVFHGRRIYSIFTHSIGRDCVAIGNILANDRITDAMVGAFVAATGESLSERLLRGLEAGRDAGGEILEPLHSAALRVTGPHGIDQCDLRVDCAEEAASALRGLLTAYGDQEEMVRRVALEPDHIPVSRQLFEASIKRIAELNLQERFPTERHRQSWTLRD
jgi:uncharacterized Ntn-hydrolase superfamily protein